MVRVDTAVVVRAAARLPQPTASLAELPVGAIPGEPGPLVMPACYLDVVRNPNIPRHLVMPAGQLNRRLCSRYRRFKPVGRTLLWRPARLAFLPHAIR